MKREFSAGGAMYKRDSDGTIWLIIQPRPSKLFPTIRYQLPKGHIHKNESVEAAATREVHEETGVYGRIISKIGYSKYPLKIGGERIFKIVTFFLMEYTSGQPTANDEAEKVIWLPTEKALQTLTISREKNILKKAAAMVKSS